MNSTNNENECFQLSSNESHYPRKSFRAHNKINDERIVDANLHTTSELTIAFHN